MKNIRNRSAIMLGMFLVVTTLDLSSAPRTRARVTKKGAPVTSKVPESAKVVT